MPARVDGDVKEGLCKLVDDAVASGWAHTRACAVLEVADVRVHRWRARLREAGTLVDRAPGGNPVHRLPAWEEQAILELIERWGPIDRSHRKLAHRGSYTGAVFVSPSSVLRVAANTRSACPASRPGRRGPRRRCRRCRGNATASGSGVPPPVAWVGYDGAVLINANGAMLGEVLAIDDDAGGPLATVHLGGANDVFGLLRFGGQNARIPADRLLYGPRRSIGSTFVAAPVEVTAPDAVIAAVTAE